MATRTSYWSGVVADPVVTTLPDGTLRLDWDADAPSVCLVTRELLVEIVDSLNARRRP